MAAPCARQIVARRGWPSADGGVGIDRQECSAVRGRSAGTQHGTSHCRTSHAARAGARRTVARRTSHV